MQYQDLSIFHSVLWRWLIWPLQARIFFLIAVGIYLTYFFFHLHLVSRNRSIYVFDKLYWEIGHVRHIFKQISMSRVQPSVILLLAAVGLNSQYRVTTGSPF